MIQRIERDNGALSSLRGDMYNLLASGFMHPDREFVAALADGSFAADVIDTVEALTGQHGSEGGVAVDLLNAARSVAHADFSPRMEAGADDAGIQGTSCERLYHDLAVEYARLFIGSPVPAVSPYESTHVDSEPGAPALLMVSPAARAVLAAYHDAGVSMAEGWNEPPDHIGTELEFMCYVCAMETTTVQAKNAGASGDSAEWRARESAFLGEHLGVWLPGFCKAVKSSAAHMFYSALAALTAAFIAVECARVRTQS